MSPAVKNSTIAPIAAIVLAAGKGTRMRSSLPKVLHPVIGRPMVGWVLGTLAEAGIDDVCLVLSEATDDFTSFFSDRPRLRVAVQANRLGTGDAVAAASWSFAGVEPPPFAAGKAVRGEPIACRRVVIMYGDVPAVQVKALQEFLSAFDASGAALGVLGFVPSTAGYGRLVTKGDELLAIVEEKDADAATKKISACNTGIVVAETKVLFQLLHDLKPDNAQREYYLTDCVKHARARGLKAMTYIAPEDAWRDYAGVNDRVQLAEVEAWLLARRCRDVMLAGVTIEQPETVRIEAGVEIGQDSVIEAGCYLAGRTRIGTGCRIGAGSVLRDSVISAGAKVPPLSVRIS